VVGLTDVLDSLEASSVDVSALLSLNIFSSASLDIPEVQNLILAILIPYNISEDSVNTSCGIGHKYNSVSWAVQNFGNGSSSYIRELGVGVANKWIGSRFTEVLILSLFIPNWERKCAERT